MHQMMFSLVLDLQACFISMDDSFSRGTAPMCWINVMFSSLSLSLSAEYSSGREIRTF
jgi:hypothetical protein